MTKLKTYNKLGRWLLLALLSAVMIGCAGNGANPPSGGVNAGDPYAVQPRLRPPAELTPQERGALQARFADVMPPQAIAALESLGTPVLSGGVGDAPASGKSGSVVIPYTFNAFDLYFTGGAGYIAGSSDVTFPNLPFPHTLLAPTGNFFPGNFSYIIYRIDDIVAQDPQSVLLEFGQIPAGKLGVGVYNWAYGPLGRWDGVYYGPCADPELLVNLDFGPGKDFTNAGNDMALVVFCLRPDSLTLTQLEVRDFAAPPVPPIADLSVAPTSGPSPLTSTLDASASFDPDGLIMSYRFDPNGDGNWINNGGSPIYEHTYGNSGVYHPTVEITDDDGLTATMLKTVIVSSGTYDEVEDNDDFATANALPAIPFTDWSGNLGPGGSEDGDQQDFYSFDANTGDKLHFIAEHGGGFFTLDLYDSNDVPFAFAGGEPAVLRHTLDGSHTGPFTLVITSFDTTSDYVLSGDDDYPPDWFEVENNDSELQANDFGGFSFTGQETDWSGSLGSGGEYVYDGDDDDWYTFDFGGFGSFPDNTQITLTLTYDDGTGNLGFTLLDNDGDVLANSATNDGQEDISYMIAPGDIGPYFIHLSSGSGWSNYLMSGTWDVPNPGLDEQEHNDSVATANTLPAIPFAIFTGNVGPGGTYDGDVEDYFTFTGNTGDLFEFTVSPLEPTAGLDIGVYDANFNPIGGKSVNSTTGEATAVVYVGSNAVAPFYLNVFCYGDPTDYAITGADGTFTEVEDNDTIPGANSLPADEVPFFVGSVGTGGSDYDGDLFDYMRFTGAVGTPVQIDLEFDKLTANGLILDLYDNEGDVIATAVDDDFTGVVNMLYTTGPADPAPYYLRVSLAGGYTDYLFSGNYFAP